MIKLTEEVYKADFDYNVALMQVEEDYLKLEELGVSDLITLHDNYVVLIHESYPGSFTSGMRRLYPQLLKVRGRLIEVLLLERV